MLKLVSLAMDEVVVAVPPPGDEAANEQVADSATVFKTVYISVSVIRHPALGTATAKYARTPEIRSERKAL